MPYRNLLLNILLAATIANSQTSAPQEAFLIQDGTPIRMRLQRTISSADAQVNEQVDFDVLDEVKVNGVVVVPKGSVAWGTITAAQAKRRMARGGKLDLNIDAVRLGDGEKVALRAIKSSAGGGHAGTMAGAMVATAIFVPIAAPLFLLMHGKDVSIPKGTEVTAYINGDVNLDQAKFEPKRAVTEPVASPAPEGPILRPPSGQADRAAVELSTVVLKSDPDGSEVIVDGRFMGNTPSTVQLRPGECTISIQKAGFTTWQRTITITPGGIVTLAAELVKN
jgi:hypothetical protein